MILLAGLYLDPNRERLAELLTCIERNAANRHIDAVHVFVEEEADVSSFPQLESQKIPIVPNGRRVTFRRLFDYANRELRGERVIVANTDVFFDRTLARLDDYDLTGWLLCLSRWDLNGDGVWRHFDYDMSQDAWIFEAPVPDIACNFHLGVLGCETRLAWEAAHAGLKLANPSRSIRAYHLPASGVRRYEHRWMDGPGRAVAPVHLDTAGIPQRSIERPQLPCAAVAFHETMGYTIGRPPLGAPPAAPPRTTMKRAPSPPFPRRSTAAASRRSSSASSRPCACSSSPPAASPSL